MILPQFYVDDLIKTENLLQPIFSLVKELVGVELVKDDKIIDELKTLAFNIENELKEKRQILQKISYWSWCCGSSSSWFNCWC